MLRHAGPTSNHILKCCHMRQAVLTRWNSAFRLPLCASERSGTCMNEVTLRLCWCCVESVWISLPICKQPNDLLTCNEPESSWDPGQVLCPGGNLILEAKSGTMTCRGWGLCCKLVVSGLGLNSFTPHCSVLTLQGHWDCLFLKPEKPAYPVLRESQANVLTKLIKHTE